MTPPGLSPSISYPGYFGGIDWGGVSVDPVRGVLIVNSNRVANYIKLVPRKDADRMGVHPSVNGGRTMVKYVYAQAGVPYAALSKPFLSPLGIPCNKPPYGIISAVDLRSRKLLWSHPLGTAHDSGPLGIPFNIPLPIGTPNTGGTLTTASGLVFVAATAEQSFRALDERTGRILWSARLPAGGQATPMTYRSRRTGRQFVVIAAGGHLGLKTKLGDDLVAFALPRPN